MASITTRKNKDGTQSWLVQIRLRGAKTISRSFRDPALAREFIAAEEPKIQQAIAGFATPDPRRLHNEPLRDTIKLYLRDGVPPRAHTLNLRTVLKHISDIANRQVDRAFLRGYWERMSARKTNVGRPFQAATIAKHFAAMSAAYRWRAESLGLTLSSVPFSTRCLPRGWDTNRERRFEPGEEERLLATVDQRARNSDVWRCVITLAIETAARENEICMAVWGEFDIAARLWRLPGHRTKSRKARAIPLSDKALDALDRLRKHTDGKPSSRMLPQFRDAASLSAAFKKLRNDAGLIDFRFHDLRHEAISRMVLRRRSLTVFEIMKIVGHSSSEMLGRYANLRGDELVGRFIAEGEAIQIAKDLGEMSGKLSAPAMGCGGLSDVASRVDENKPGDAQQGLSREGQSLAGPCPVATPKRGSLRL